MRRQTAALLIVAALTPAGCGPLARAIAKGAGRAGGQAAPKVAPKVAGSGTTTGGKAVAEGAQQIGGAALGGDRDSRKR